MGRKLALTVFLGLVVCGVVALSAGADVGPQLTVGNTSTIVNTTADQKDPAVFGDIVVWADKRNSATTGWDIYMYDLSTGVESPVCTAAGVQENPAIFGKTVVWEDGRNLTGNSDIYSKNLLTGVETPISTAAKKQHQPQIFGDTVVWKDWRNDTPTPWTNSDIYMYDMFTGVTTAVCVAAGNQGQPDIYGDVVVWRDDRFGAGNSDIYIEDLTTGMEGPLAAPVGQQWFPRIYENMVVWQDSRSGTYRIYAYDLSDGTEWPVSVTSGGQYGPVPFGGAVVWTRQASLPAGQTDVYVTDMGTGIDSAVASLTRDEQVPELSGNLVVWEETFGSVDNDVYAARLDGVSKKFVPLEGATRYDTAAAASRDAYKSAVPVDIQGYRTAIIATGRNWPDALGASALAGALDAPVMIVQPTYVPQPVKDELTRVGITRAIIVGGEGAVSQQVATELAGLGIGKVERISGANRYETAEEVARYVKGVRGSKYDGVAFVATGRTFPDALAASPIAAAKGWPVFLVGPTGISPATWKAMSDIGVSKVHILGGTGAVSVVAETQLKALYGAANVTRQQGATRYETAVAVARFGVDGVGLQWDTLAFATGEDFPDALSGGALQARTYSVLLLTRGDSLPQAVESRLLAEKGKIATAKYLGGQGAISAAARAQIAAALQ